VPQSDFFEIFPDGKHAYKGKVNHEGFELKRKRRHFGEQISLAKSTGKFMQVGDRLEIDIEVKAFHFMMAPYFTILSIIYLGLFVLIITGTIRGYFLYFTPLIFIHALFMFGIPYFMMKRSIVSAKYDLERDLYFMAKDKLNIAQQL
jgi:hypothetical protein